eukprot:2616841-Karenia_brevis.AAC.1
MAIFWEAHKIDWGLQSWTDSKSQQTRSGTLSEDNYNFLHGFPATPIRKACPRFWYEFRTNPNHVCECEEDWPDDKQ